MESYPMNLVIKQPSEQIKDNLIVKHYAGSMAYGTNIETSDTDFRGIFIADPVNIRTPFYRIDECKDTSEEDTVIYELNQFMKLALDCNPNVVESLWIDVSDIVHTTPAYEWLRFHAPQLLSSKIAFTTSGYALSQLKRIKGHNKWISQAERGINKLRKLLADNEITKEWLESNFDDNIVFQVTRP